MIWWQTLRCLCGLPSEKNEEETMMGIVAATEVPPISLDSTVLKA